MGLLEGSGRGGKRADGTQKEVHQQHIECQKVERGQRGRGSEGAAGTVIGRGVKNGDNEGTDMQRERTTGGKGMRESKGVKDGEVRDASGTTGRGDGHRGWREGGGVGVWGVIMMSGAGGYWVGGWWKDGREGHTFVTFNNSLRVETWQKYIIII